LTARRGPAPLSDAVISAMGHLVDDSQVEPKRQPSHWDLNQQFEKAGLPDPTKDGPPQGKRKRVQSVLNWALEHDEIAGEKLVGLLLASIRGAGGFREGSPNYVGEDSIRNAAEVFRSEGFQLSPDGQLLQDLLDNLTGVQLTEALGAYVRRARRGALDAALVTSTGKDLAEATAAHVLVERMGTYPTTQNFPTLLGQAYVSLGLCYDAGDQSPALDRLDAALYQAACAVNTLRNKEGTGHGRPFLPNITHSQARRAVQIMGIIAERLLTGLKASQ
jgi:hypothetical protein